MPKTALTSIAFAGFLIGIVAFIGSASPVAAVSPPGVTGPEKPGVGWEHVFEACRHAKEIHLELGILRDPSDLPDQFTDPRTNCDHYWQAIDVIGHPPDYWLPGPPD